METRRRSCVVLGQGTVAERCEAVLRSRGWDVRGFYANVAELDGHAVGSFDYLFSLNNPWVLSSEVLAKPRCRTLNFHDSPLPRYAGLHATSWALMHGEREHAVTFHDVVEEVDAGAILKQARFDILEEDTAFSVNTRALEVAVDSFEELLQELETQTERAVPQALGDRSYYGLRDRPNAACLISLGDPARAVRDLVRALDFGPADNPLGLAKLMLPGGPVTVRRVRIAPGRVTSASGTVLAISDGEIELALGGERVALSGLAALGEHLPLDAQALRMRGAVQGSVLPTLGDAAREVIHDYNRRVCGREQRLAQRLAEAAPLAHPFAHGTCLDVNPAPEWVELGVRDADAVTLLSALLAYGHRFAEEDDFDVGYRVDVPRAARPFFASCLPLRFRWAEQAGTMSFASLKAAVESELQWLERQAGCALDLVGRFRALQGRTLPQFPLVFASLSSPEALGVDGLPEATLVLCHFADGSPPRVRLRGLREAWQPGAVATHLRCILEAAAEAPDTSLAELPMMTPEEAKRVVVEWNQTGASTPCDQSLHTLVRRQALATPDAVAVRAPDGPLTYGALESRSNRLAVRLRAQGAGKGTFVAVCLPRGTDLIAAMLAVAKVGAAYVPIDPGHPGARARFILRDSGAACALTTRKLREKLLGDDVPGVCVDGPDRDVGGAFAEVVCAEVEPDSPIYVMYTSGTTGEPKGVVVSHAALVNHSWSAADQYGMSEVDRVLQSASCGFDVAAEQIWPALLRGAEVVVRPDELMESFERFEAFVVDWGVSVLILPTAFWHEWIADMGDAGRRVPACVRALGVGTEKAVGAKLAQWRSLCSGDVRFVHGYGPTETTVTCTMFVSESAEDFPADAEIPIGRPLPNVQAYVLDRYEKPVPVGLPGALYVGGRGLANGYHARPELTAERFVPHPLLRVGRVYATGDRVYQRPDGQLMFLGREDGQVKIRGHRVELAEVEAALAACPGVAAAAAKVMPLQGTASLIGYVVPSADALDEVQLRSELAERVPGYMVPSAFVLLDALPVTPNGKVDRSVLPDRASVGPRARPFTAPRDDLELRVSHLFEELLELHHIDIHDSFFDLGGHSLLAARLARGLREMLGVEFSLGALFERPSIAGIAESLRGTAGACEVRSHLLPLQKRGHRPPLYFICGINLYRSWALALGPDQPSYGIYLPEEEAALAGRGERMLCVEQAAAGYVEVILQHQPEGPLSLAGVSFGGVLAYEVARQLRAAGREVLVLMMVDAVVPTSTYFNPTHYLSSRVRSAAKSLVSRVFGSRVFRRIRRPKRQRHESGVVAAPRVVAPCPVEEELRLAQLRRDDAYYRAAAAYDQRPHEYAGHTVLIRAADHIVPHRHLLHDLGWGKRIRGPLRVFLTPGDHLGVLQESATAVISRHELEAVYAQQPVMRWRLEGMETG